MPGDTDPQALDTAIGAWTTARRSGREPQGEAPPRNAGAPGPEPGDLVRLDGKTVYGAVDADGQQLHLLAALAGSVDPGTPAVVIGQVNVAGAKTNEPARARDLLETLNHSAHHPGCCPPRPICRSRTSTRSG